jgi:hypothetical protein
MKTLFSLLYLYFALAAMGFTGAVEGKEYHVFFLGGQSNMDGYGWVRELPAELKSPQSDVMIFHGNSAPDGVPADGRGRWEPLQPGHGVRFHTDGKTATYSDRFGVELTFARRLCEPMPDCHIALIKYSRGGTSIDQQAARSAGSWDPDFKGGEGAGAGINQYDHFLATIRNAMAVRDIDGDGEDDTLVPSGIVWMQGEADAHYSEETALRYEANLTRLINLFRAAFRVDDLHAVIGRISDSGRDDREKDGKIWNYGDTVRAAQEAFVARDGNAALITSTDGYGYSDPYHYDSEGYIDLGKKFAEALTALTAGSASDEAMK